MCMFIMSLWGIISAIIVVTASAPTHILVGRVINCEFHEYFGYLKLLIESTDIYIGMELSVVPIYQVILKPSLVAVMVADLYIAG
jgi:hypothetical protein